MNFDNINISQKNVDKINNDEVSISGNLSYIVNVTDDINLSVLLEMRYIESLSKLLDKKFYIKINDLIIENNNENKKEKTNAFIEKLKYAGFFEFILLSEYLNLFFDFSKNIYNNKKGYCVKNNNNKIITLRSIGMRQFINEEYHDPIIMEIVNEEKKFNYIYASSIIDIHFDINNVYLNNNFNNEIFTYKHFFKLLNKFKNVNTLKKINIDVNYSDILKFNLNFKYISMIFEEYNLFSAQQINISLNDLLKKYIKLADNEIPRLFGILCNDLAVINIDDFYCDENKNKIIIQNYNKNNESVGKRELKIEKNLMINKHKMSTTINLAFIGSFEQKKYGVYYFVDAEKKKNKISWLPIDNFIIDVEKEDKMFIEKSINDFKNKTIVQIYDYGFYFYDGVKLLKI